jgi:hypothetical protein
MAAWWSQRTTPESPPERSLICASDSLAAPPCSGSVSLPTAEMKQPCVAPFSTSVQPPPSRSMSQ